MTITKIAYALWQFHCDTTGIELQDAGTCIPIPEEKHQQWYEISFSLSHPQKSIFYANIVLDQPRQCYDSKSRACYSLSLKKKRIKPTGHKQTRMGIPEYQHKSVTSSHQNLEGQSVPVKCTLDTQYAQMTIKIKA